MVTFLNITIAASTKNVIAFHVKKRSTNGSAHKTKDNLVLQNYKVNL